MDEGRKDAVIKWINCLHIGPEIPSLRELHDGRHFVSLLKIMKTESEKGKFLLRNWTSIVKHFLEDHYDVGLRDDLNFAEAERKNEFELAKISILLLCASIHCDGKEQFIKAMCKLDSPMQEIVKSIIEGVLSPSGTTLCHDFAKVLKVTDSSVASNCAVVPAMKIHQDKSIPNEKQRGCTIYCNDVEDAYSPIKQCVQSPQVTSWTALKEKEIEIHKLKGNLEAELTSRSYLELDLEDLKKENEKLSASVDELKKRIRDLTEKCDSLNECQILLTSTDLAFQKLQVKCEEQSKLVSDYPSLELAYKSVSQENRSLEENLARLEKQIKTSEARVKEFNDAEDNLANLKGVLFLKNNELKCLAATAKDQEAELTEMRLTNKEMTRLLEEKSKCKDFTSGETMTIVSDIIALENDIKRLHEEALVKEKQIERMTKSHFDEKSQLVLEVKNTTMTAQRAEEDIQCFKADVKLLKDDLSKLDNKLASAQEQRLKDQRELKAVIKQQREDIEFLLNDLKEKSAKLSDLEALSSVQREELESCHSEMKNKSTCITKLEEENAQIVSDRVVLLSEKEALASEINCLQADMQRVSVAIQEKCDENASLAARLADQTEELKNCNQELVKIKVLVDDLEVQKVGMNTKYSMLIKEKAVLDAEAGSCRSKIQSLSLDLQIKCSESATLASEALTQKMDLESLRKELESRCEHVVLLEMQNGEISSKNQELVKENDILSLELNSCRVKLDQFSVSLKEKHSAVTLLESNVQNLEGKLDDFSKELNAKDVCIQELEALKTEMDTNYKTLMNAKDVLEEELSSTHTQIENLSSELHSRSSELSSLTSEAAEQNTELENCRHELESRDERVKQLETQAEEMNVQHKKLVEEKNGFILKINFLSEEIDRLNLDLEEKNLVVTDLEANVKNLEGKLDLNVQDLSARNANIEHLEACKMEIDAKYQMLIKEKMDLEAEISSCHTTIEKLLTDSQHKSLELSSLQSEVTNQKTDLENYHKELESKDKRLKQLEAQEMEMAIEHEMLFEKHNSMVLENGSCKENIDQLSIDLQGKHTEVTSLKSDLKNLEENLKSLQRELIDKNTRIEVLELQESEMDEKYNVMVEEKRSLSSENASLEERFVSLSQDFLSKCTEVSSLRESSACLEEEVHKCNKEFEAKSARIDQLMAINIEISAKYEGLEKEKVALVSEASSNLEKLERLHQLESQNAQRQQHHDGMLRRNMELTTENGNLKIELQQLKNKLGREKDFNKQNVRECTEQIVAMQAQIQDAEKRHLDILRSIMEEKQSFTKKYEKAKTMVEEMSGQLQTKDEVLEKLNIQLENYREHYQASRESLMKVMSLQKSAEQEKALLEERLNKELEKSVQQAAHIKKLELLLNQHIQKTRHRHSYSDDTFVKPQQIEQKPKGNPRRPSITVTYNSAESFNLVFDDQLQNSTLSINSAPQDIKMDNAFAHPRAIVPPGASNYFPCEDEEGELLNFSYLNDQNADTKELPSKNLFVQPSRSLTSLSRHGEDADGAFSNFSYLNDLKNGRCELPNKSERLSELQRRNTLCLPHLKTSYPVEMQAQTSISYNDEDFKTGKLDVTGLSQISTIHGDQVLDLTCDALGAKKKGTKPIQPTYQKPGPPTPGKSSKSGAGQDKPGKTPSSLKRLLRRPHFRTPKGSFKARMTPKKTRENQPPEQNQGPMPRRNLAFTIGLSPKVKSHPKSLAMSKKTSTPKK